MKLEEEPYKGYRAFLEHGTIVWYRTTSTASVGVSMKTGKEIRHPSRINRIVTIATTFEDAKAMLDRALEKPKKEPVFVVPKNQTKMF